MVKLPSNAPARYAFWTGVAIVALTHVYMLVVGLPASMMMGHAIINLIAAALVTYGWTKQ